MSCAYIFVEVGMKPHKLIENLKANNKDYTRIASALSLVSYNSAKGILKERKYTKQVQ